MLSLPLTLFYTHDSQPQVAGLVQNACYYSQAPFRKTGQDFYSYKVSVLKEDEQAILYINLYDVSVDSRVSHPLSASSPCSVQSAQTVFDRYQAVIPLTPGRAFETRIFSFSEKSCTIPETYPTVDRVDITCDNVRLRVNDFTPIVIIQNYPAIYGEDQYIDGHITYFGDGIQTPISPGASKNVEITVRYLPSGHGRCTLLTGEALFKEPTLPPGYEAYTSDTVTEQSDEIILVNELLLGDLVKSFQINYQELDRLFANKLIRADSQIQVVAPLRGFLPTRFIDESMTQADPYTIGLSLLLACHKQDNDMLMAVLLEVIHLFVSNGSIVYEGSRPVPAPTPSWGLPQFFSADSDFLINRYKPVADNAWLGICLCRSLRFLQDRLPLGSYNLSGTYPSLEEHLRATIRSLAFLATYSISPTQHWCAERLDLDTYNFYEFSLESSYLVSVFLSEYLELDYSFFVHSRAADLYQVIKDSPVDPTDPFYSLFTAGVDNRAQLSPEEAEAKLLRDIKICSLRCLWEAKFGSHPTFIEASKAYERLRELYTDETDSEPDQEYLQIYLYSVARKFDVFNRYDWAPNRWADWSGDTPLYFNRFNKLGEYYSATTTPDFHPTSWYYLVSEGFSLLNTPAFDLYAESVSAEQGDVLQLLRRMWGSGQTWPTIENRRDIHSNIGSVLFAESETYKDWYYVYHLIQEGVNLARAQGPALTAWEKTTTFNFGMASDFFKRNWLYLYISRPKDNLTALVNGFKRLFGMRFTIVPPEIKPFNRLQDFVTFPDNFDSYELQLSNARIPFIDSDQYLTIVYKPGPRALQPRRVPGFTYLDITCDETAVTADSLLPVNYNVTSTPEQDGYVKDGPVLVMPLYNHFPRVIIDAEGRVPDNLIRFVRSTMPAGVKVDIRFEEGFSMDLSDPPYLSEADVGAPGGAAESLWLTNTGGFWTTNTGGFWTTI